MNNRVCRAVPLLLILLPWSLANMAEPTAAEEVHSILEQGYAPGEVLLKVRARLAKSALPETGAWSDLHRKFAVQSIEPLFVEAAGRSIRAKKTPEEALAGWYKLRIHPSADVRMAVSEYSVLPEVLYAQPNMLRRFQRAPDDPKYGEQWALSKIGWESIWEHAKDFAKVIVAILDSGVDYAHEDLNARIWINRAEWEGVEGVDDDGNGYIDDLRGWDFTDAPTLPGTGDHVDRDNDPMDESGHGTHIAGIIGAVPDNGRGIAGIAPNALLMVLRAGFNLPTGGFLEDDDIAAAIVYAADNGARVINMSWGDPRFSPLIRDGIRYATYAGCVLVAAAGNESEEALFYPARLDETIAVGASNTRDELASFSNYGWNLDVLAPGVGILSTGLQNTYTLLSGTSMATPHVAGLAALLLGENPDYTPEDVRALIRASAQTPGSAPWSPRYGAGRVDLRRALTGNVPALVQILQPQTGDGTDSSLVVIGTATGAYELSYGAGTDPQRWTQLVRSVRQAWRDTLTLWDTSALPDSLYVLRLIVEDGDGRPSEDRVVVTVDHTPPGIGHIRVVERLDKTLYIPVIEWQTDDPTSGEIHYRDVGAEISSPYAGPYATLPVPFVETHHSVEVSDVNEPGTYAFYVMARNAAGLTAQSPEGTFTIRRERVSEEGYAKIAELPDGYLINRLSDFDHNGRKEVAVMPYGDQPYSPVQLYEVSVDGTPEWVFTTSTAFLPWNVSDLDHDGRLELMGVNAAHLYLFESPDPASFPSIPIWDVAETWGGDVADLDGDGRMDILARSNETKGLVIFENSGDNTFRRVHILPNPTEGDNDIGTRSVVADFDGDGRNEIVSGDADGDLYLYEAVAEDVYQHTRTYSVKGTNAQILAGGSDLDEDGRREFVVARTAGDPDDPRSQRWIVSVYQAIGNDAYEVEWEIEIAGVQTSGNGLSIGDADGDGRDELVVCTRPDLYLFKSERENEYRPIWHAETSLTYAPVIGDLDGDGLPEILFNQDKHVVIYEHETIPGPLPPTGLTARPVDASTVELDWNTEPDASIVYRIYRGTTPQELMRIAEDIPHSPYLDRHLSTYTTYFYAISAVHRALEPPEESRRSRWVTATPNPAPQLVKAQALSPRHIAVYFNEPMGPSARHLSSYRVSAEVGSPSSATLDQGGVRSILGFEHELRPGRYTLWVQGVQDTSGVALDGPMSTPFSVEAPSTDLRLISAEIRSPTEIRLSFSVELQEPLDPSAFSVRPDVVVQSVYLDATDRRTVHLLLDAATPLRARGQRYEIQVTGLRDVYNHPLEDHTYLKMAEHKLSRVVVFPNPCPLSEPSILGPTFAGLTAWATIRIYSPEGTLLRTLTETDGDGGLTWDGRNAQGERVGSGVYLYIVENEEEQRVGKLALIR